MAVNDELTFARIIQATPWTREERAEMNKLSRYLSYNDNDEHIQVVWGCTHDWPCEFGDPGAPCRAITPDEL
jgi:hypothetical protein